MNVILIKLQESLAQKKPFVVYREPQKINCCALFQKNKKIYKTDALDIAGFIFAPFDTTKEKVLIPLSVSKFIEEEVTVSVKNQQPILGTISSEEKQQHTDLVNKAINAIKNGAFEKVVVSRKQEIEMETQDVTVIFTALLQRYSSAFVYCWYHPTIGLWLGASPETLVKTKGKTFTTIALAGTQSFSENQEAKWQPKEQHEHAVVVAYIKQRLGFISDLKIAKTKTVRAANLCHLQTKITGSFVANQFNSIVEQLHPTPAVCGFPTEKAKQFILENEAYERSFYTGFFGPIHIKEHSHLAVNLRCMQLKNQKALLYIGGGITKDSNAVNEWQETIEKSKVMQVVL